MRPINLVLAGLTASVLAALSGSASAIVPYPFENYSAVPDGRSAPFVGTWSVRIEGKLGRTIATCAVPLEIEATGARSLVYRPPNDPAASIELIAEDRHTTWRSSVAGGSFIAVWTQADSFYLYDQALPDLGGPYAFTRCD